MTHSLLRTSIIAINFIGSTITKKYSFFQKKMVCGRRLKYLFVFHNLLIIKKVYAIVHQTYSIRLAYHWFVKMICAFLFEIFSYLWWSCKMWNIIIFNFLYIRVFVREDKSLHLLLVYFPYVLPILASSSPLSFRAVFPQEFLN